jgi:hypothetical protein
MPTITYDPAANVVIAVGGSGEAPLGVGDLWNADKAGTRMLLESTVHTALNGYTTVGSETAGTANYLYASSKFTVSKRVKAQSIKIYIKAACNMRAAIYTNTGGNLPGSLVVQSGSESCSANAWHTFVIAETVLSAGTYWIAWNCDMNSTVVRDGVGATLTYSRAYTFGLLPASWGSAQYSGSTVTSAYVAVSYEYSLTSQIRPTDAKALKLSIVVSALTGSVPLTISGLDKDGNAQTETLTVDTTTTFTTTKWFKSVDTNGLFFALDEGESMTCSIMQPQWGVVWNQGTQYGFDCKLQIGDGTTPTYFADILKQVVLNSGVFTATYRCSSQ